MSKNKFSVSNIKDIFIKILLVLFIPLIIITSGELFLRFITSGAIYLSESNPHYLDNMGWVRLKPNTNNWWYGCSYKINKSGFRMTHDVSKNNIFRILAIGDSITLGMGVKRTSDVWPSRLESMINAYRFEPVEVINSGVQGWNLLKYDKKNNLVPGEFTDFVRDYGRKIHPNIILYCICLNDIPTQVQTIYQSENANNKARFKLFSEGQREWFKRKAIYRLFRDGYRELRFRKLDYSKITSASISNEVFEAAQAELTSLNRVARSMGAKLYCIIVPYSFQLLTKNRELLRVNIALQGALGSSDVSFIDITSFMDEKTVLKYYALGDYIHLNSLGHKLIAQKAFDLIKDELNNLR